MRHGSMDLRTLAQRKSISLFAKTSAIRETARPLVSITPLKYIQAPNFTLRENNVQRQTFLEAFKGPSISLKI